MGKDIQLNVAVCFNGLVHVQGTRQSVTGAKKLPSKASNKRRYNTETEAGETTDLKVKSLKKEQNVKTEDKVKSYLQKEQNVKTEQKVKQEVKQEERPEKKQYTFVKIFKPDHDGW